MDTVNLVVVSGGLSEDSSTSRLADMIARAVEREHAEGRGGVREFAEGRGGVRDLGAGGEARRSSGVVVTRIGLRDVAREIGESQVTGFAGPRLAEALEAVGRADALVAASPTFKASYSGLFKSFWDMTPSGALAGVPVVVAATGGTARHSLMLEAHMRPLFAFLGALVMPTGVFAAAEDWGSAAVAPAADGAVGADDGGSLGRRVERAARELARQMGAGERGGDERDADDRGADERNTRVREEAEDPFAHVPTFDEMMRRLSAGDTGV